MNFIAQYSITSLLLVGFVFHMKAIFQNCKNSDFVEALVPSLHEFIGFDVLPTILRVVVVTIGCLYFKAPMIATTYVAIHAVKLSYVAYVGLYGKKVLSGIRSL